LHQRRPAAVQGQSQSELECFDLALDLMVNAPRRS
jgi:hypothetical protein